MEEKIREELYSKLESEFDSYKKELETLTSKEIIDKSYETTMKEELMCLFYPESQRYDLDEIKALKNEKNSLETLYQGWMDSDLNINQLLEDNTDEIIAELAEEYKAKQSKKKSKGKVGNSMAYYQPEEIRKAKEMDLYTYLKNYEPDELVHFSRDTYMTRTHDSLKISNGMWYWFSRGIGGKTALEYLIQVREYTFIQAVETILGYSNDRPPVVYQQPKKVQNIRLILPKKSITTDKVMNYLIGRGIDKDIISECIDNRLIYEDLPNHNVVFVGYDKNKVPRYAGVRATNNSRYMKDAYGSHKAFSFKLDSLEKSDTVHLFESAIDLLSYATLNKLENKEWYNDNLLSLAGVYQPAKKIDESKIPLALNYYLNQNQNIKKIYLHFDNDSAGRIATMALKTVLPKQYEVIDDPPKIGKDFNDFLCAKVGINYKKDMKKKGEIMKFDYLKLANIIKTRRNEKGISTRKLAEKIGISHAEISRFENGLKPSFYLIPFVKMCEELELDIEDLLIEVGLLSEIEDKKYEVKVTNVNEDYFEIEARNQKEAALIVAKFVIENEIIEIDTTIPIEFEVEEIEEEPEEDFEEDDDELDAESFMKMQCENCKHYCPYCGKCSLGE